MKKKACENLDDVAHGSFLFPALINNVYANLVCTMFSFAVF